MRMIKTFAYLVLSLPMLAEDIDTSVTRLKKFTCETFNDAVYKDRTKPVALVGQTVIITFSHVSPVIYTPYNNPGMRGIPRVFGKIVSADGATVPVSVPVDGKAWFEGIPAAGKRGKSYTVVAKVDGGINSAVSLNILGMAKPDPNKPQILHVTW